MLSGNVKYMSDFKFDFRLTLLYDNGAREILHGSQYKQTVLLNK